MCIRDRAWSATLYTTVSDMFPKKTVASLIGMGGMAGSVGGILFPIITGVVLDSFKNGYTMIFGYCSLAYVLALVINNLLAPDFKTLSFEKALIA